MSYTTMLRAPHVALFVPTRGECALFVTQWLLEAGWAARVQQHEYRERALANAIGWASR